MKVLDEIDFINGTVQNRINLDILKKSIEKDTLSHAYLFLGNDTEKLHRLALHLSAAISCPEGGCGRCNICKNVLKGLHSDVSIIEAEGNVLRKDKIIQLQQFLHTSSYSHKKKICIIKEAELMNPTAANRLLKTLEEPPDSSNLIILLAEDSSRLLPTIISRCLVFTWDFGTESAVKEIDPDQVRSMLEEGLKKMLVSSEGLFSLRLSSVIIQKLDDAQAEILRSRDKEIGRLNSLGLDQKDMKKTIDAVKDRYQRNVKRARYLGMNSVFDIISAWLEDILAVKAGALSDALNFKDDYGIIKDNCKDIKTNDIFRLIDVIDRNKRFLKFSIDEKISLDNILLSLESLN